MEELTLLHWEFFIDDNFVMVKELRTNDAIGEMPFSLDEIKQQYDKIYEQSDKETLEENFNNFIENNIEYL